jgi:hypothetical protein
MTNAVLLDNVAHKDLRVRTGYAAEFGDNINLAPVFPTEFAFAQREYPILFRKGANGNLEAVVLLGLDKGENLFLDENGWNARYVPAIQRRGPFLIGVHPNQDEASERHELMVHVDLDHPRISRTEGAPVFLRHGGNSPYLERATRMLQMIAHGAEYAQPMFSAFVDAGLIDETELEVKLNESTQYTLPDFLTINQERLAELDGQTLERMNQAGYLQLAMLVVTSLGNMNWLVELKNRKIAAGQA